MSYQPRNILLDLYFSINEITKEKLDCFENKTTNLSIFRKKIL